MADDLTSEVEEETQRRLDAGEWVSPSRRSKVRRYGGSKPITQDPDVDRGNEIAYQNSELTDNSTINTILTTGEQIGKNAISGVLQIPTDIAYLGQAAITGGAAAIDAIFPDNEAQERQSYIQRLGYEFVTRVQPPEVIEELQKRGEAYAKNKLIEQGKSTGNMDEIRGYLDEYQNSKAAQDLLIDHMPAGMRLGQEWHSILNEVLNTGKRPDQETMIDELAQIAGPALIGPALLTKGLKGYTAKIIKTLLANSGKAALAEFTIGAGLTEGIRELTHSPNISSGGIAEFDPEPIRGIEPGDGHGYDVDKQTIVGATATGLTIAAILGNRVAMKMITKKSDELLDKSIISNIEEPDAKTIAEQDPKDYGTGKKDIEEASGDEDVTTAINESSPYDSNNNSGGTTGGDDLPPTSLAEQSDHVYTENPVGPLDVNEFRKPEQLLTTLQQDTKLTAARMAELQSASGSNVMQAVNNAYVGTRDGVTNAVPTRALVDLSERMKPKQRDLYNDAMFAYDAKANRQLRGREQGQVLTDLKLRRAEGDITPELEAKIKEQIEIQGLIEADDPSIRTSMNHWNNDKLDALIADADADPMVKNLMDLQRQVNLEETQMLAHTGHMSVKAAHDMHRNNPYYVPLRERKEEGFKQRVLGRFVENSELREVNQEIGYGQNSRNLHNAPNSPVVNKPMDALSASLIHNANAVMAVTQNKARRSFIDAVLATPQGTKHIWKRDKSKKLDAKEQRHLVSVMRDGKKEEYIVGDSTIVEALKFAPNSATHIWKASARIWQQWTTGKFAPWFAPKMALWDIPLASITRPKGRSMGYPDTYFRKMLGDGPRVNAIADKFVDPTAFLMPIHYMGYNMAAKVSGAIVNKMKVDLLNDGFLKQFAKQIPGGDEFVYTGMLRAVQSLDRWAFNSHRIFTENFGTHASHFDVGTKTIDRAHTAMENLSNSIPSIVSKPMKMFFDSYAAGIESLQSSTRMGFWNQNYGRLLKQYKGNIPEIEIKALVNDTRNLTGDMSRQSLNKTHQNITGFIPYSNAIMQGTRHMLSQGGPNSKAGRINFMSRYATMMGIPMLGMYTLLNSWPEADSYWHDKVPEWERGSHIPIISPEAISELMTTGKWPEDVENSIIRFPISPEFQMLNAPILSMAKHFGLVSPSSNSVLTEESSFLNDIGKTMGQVTSFASPPLMQAMFAMSDKRLDIAKFFQGESMLTPLGKPAFSGANSGDLEGGMDRMIYNVIGALFGSGGKLLAQSIDAGMIESIDHDNYWDAVDQGVFKTVEHLKGGIEEKLPINMGGVASRIYSYTPESEYVFDTLNTLKPAIDSRIGQRTVDLNSKQKREYLMQQGLIPPNQIKHPLLSLVNEKIYTLFNKKGRYKVANEMYSETRRELSALQRTMRRMTHAQFKAKERTIIVRQQNLRSIQAKEIKNLDGQLKNSFGPHYQQQFGIPFSFENHIDLIKEDTKQR